MQFDLFEQQFTDFHEQCKLRFIENEDRESWRVLFADKKGRASITAGFVSAFMDYAKYIRETKTQDIQLDRLERHAANMSNWSFIMFDCVEHAILNGTLDKPQ